MEAKVQKSESPRVSRPTSGSTAHRLTSAHDRSKFSPPNAAAELGSLVPVSYWGLGEGGMEVVAMSLNSAPTPLKNFATRKATPITAVTAKRR